MYSVIIPTYNRRSLVMEAIDSVLRQNGDDIEIIVIDDGSTDGTVQALSCYGDAIRYYYQPNQGQSAARNVGITMAKGQYITFLDSDDVWLPGKLARDRWLFANHPDVDMVAGNAESYLEGKLRSPSVFAVRNILFVEDNPRYFDWSIEILQQGPICLTSALTIKRSVIDSLAQPVFDESLRFDEDWDLEFKLFSSCTALLDNQVLTQIRSYDDGTRSHYSMIGKTKSPAELRNIWQIKARILERYVGNIGCEPEIERCFARSHEQLLAQLEQSKHWLILQQQSQPQHACQLDLWR